MGKWCPETSKAEHCKDWEISAPLPAAGGKKAA
jgi:hypothetical protein